MYVFIKILIQLFRNNKKWTYTTLKENGSINCTLGDINIESSQKFFCSLCVKMPEKR